MTITFTPEQLAIIEAAANTSDNLLISALAGAAKTTTLVEVAKALPETKMLCLAFNKKIADEMKIRLPPNCTAMTLNGLGHRVWGEVLGRRAEISSTKVGDIVTGLIEKIQDFVEKKEAKDAWFDLIRAVSWGKSQGWIPDGYGRQAKPVMTDAEFKESHEENLSDWEFDLIREATIISLDMAWKGRMDFDDQILMPACFPAAMPRFPLILIDEAQDLSPLNHRLLKKLVVKRIIAVGDECQAIYGFRGASHTSMAQLQKEFNMTELRLSISFRCPIEVVKHAQWRAPHMQHASWAKQGAVKYPPEWTLADIPPDAAILCRNNAPLFSLAVKMLSRGRPVELSGNDIGKGLLRVMKKLGPTTLTREQTITAIGKWEADKISKAKESGSIRDRAECMRVFAEQGQSLGEALAYAEHMFSSQSPTKLMTIHKSKGLEFEEIFILERDLIGVEGQERNLRYVAQTRAKHSITYIEFETWEGI